MGEGGERGEVGGRERVERGERVEGGERVGRGAKEGGHIDLHTPTCASKCKCPSKGR